jgi:signal peptidase I
VPDESTPEAEPDKDAGTTSRPRDEGEIENKKKNRSFLKELPILIGVALVLSLLIKTFLVQAFFIPSESMERTLHGCAGCTGDRILVEKVGYDLHDPRPGDIVVFRAPPAWEPETQIAKPSNPVRRAVNWVGAAFGLPQASEKDLVKRVIAVGGQTVACCDAQNRVTVDGRSLNEPYIYYVPDSLPKQQEKFGPVVVPKGDLWMMGDSRNNSQDSRWPGQGPVPISDVVGKARFVVLPLHRIRAVPDPNPQEVSLSAGTGPTGPPLAFGLLGAVPVTLGGRQLGRRFRRWLAARRGGGSTGVS